MYLTTEAKLKLIMFVNEDIEMVIPTKEVLAAALEQIGDYQTFAAPSNWPVELLSSIESPLETNIVQLFGNPLVQEELPKSSRVIRLRSKSMISSALRHHSVTVNELAVNSLKGDYGRLIGVKTGVVVLCSGAVSPDQVPLEMNALPTLQWKIFEYSEKSKELMVMV